MTAVEAPTFFGAAHRPEWLALHDEPVIRPDLPIVDAHHHLWEHPAERYLLPELVRDLGDGHRIVATVHVQCGHGYRRAGPSRLAPVGETQVVSTIAHEAMALGIATRVCAGIVGYADLRDPRVDEVLLAHLEVDPVRFKGIRQATAWDPDGRLVNPMMGTCEGMYLDPAFRRGFARLAPLGMSFDAWALHPQLDDVLDLARAFPETVIVLDHIGAPLGEGRFKDRHEEIYPSWRQSIERLAACPNVFMKLGGLGLPILGFGFARAARPLDSSELARRMKPWIGACIDAFGPARCMFESNFPVDRFSFGYRTCWNAFKRLAEGFSEGEQASLFSATASRVYRLADIPAQ